MFQWVEEVLREQEGALEGHDLEASRTLVDLEGSPEEEGRHVAAEDKDREPRVAEEAAAGHKLRRVAVEVHPAVSRLYAQGQRPAIAPRQA